MTSTPAMNEPYLVSDINATTYSSNPSSFINVGGILYFTANNDTNGLELYKADISTGVVSLIEINAGSGSSSPTYLTDVNGTLYFQAYDPTNGYELWKIGTNGTPTRIDLGSDSSSPANLTNVNGTLYFVAYTPTNGYELWKIDPTTGTPSVIDIVSGSGSSFPTNLTNANGTLYFRASTSATGYELWKIDSTTGSPVFLKDIQVGNGSSNPGNLTYSNGKIYFTADNFTQGVELWQTDGTPEGTVLTQDINATTYSSNPSSFINVGGILYFTANNDINGIELYKADTSTGVVSLIEINAGSGSSSPTYLTDVNGTLYFQANDPTNGSELWKIGTNGTLTRIDLGTGGSSPNNLTNVNGTLYFTAYGYNGVNYLGYELWKIDPTTGTPSVIDIVSGSGTSSPSNLININGVLYFTASTSATGSELWKLDPANNLPVLISDLYPGANSSNPSNFINSGGTVYFIANNSTNGHELFRIDPTTGNPVLLDIYAGANSSSPNGLIDINGTLYFKADDGVNGNQLWKIDPTTGNPVRLVVPDLYDNNAAYLDSFTNVGGKLYFRSSYYNSNTTIYQPLYTIDSTTGNPVAVAGVSYVSNLTNINGVLYFQGYTATNGFELWKIDSTTGQPVVIDIVSGGGSSSPTNLTNVNGTLFFAAYNVANGQELWKIDSTGNPVLVKDINPGSGYSSPSSLFNVNGTLYFTANDGTNGVELWKSDGTTAGTVLAKDINGRTYSSDPNSLIDINGTLYFKADDGVNGNQLWKIDPTTGNPVRLVVPDLPSGYVPYLDSFTNVGGKLYFRSSYYSNSTYQPLYTIDSSTGNPVTVAGVSYVSSLININGVLYFQAYTATNGFELWKIDSTTGKPVVIDIVSGSGSSSPTNLTNVNGTLFFTASNAANGEELWKLDSTGNPVLVKDIYAGSNGSSPGSLFNVNGTLYFTANNGTNGVELWKSDGTAAGTVLAKDINGRTYSSSPNGLIDVNGTLYFKANDGVNGNQLWKIDPTTGNPVRLVVPDLPSGYVPYLDSFTNVGGKLYFRSSYYSNSTYQPLYTIDSSTGNPVTVAGVSYVSSLININGVLYFQAYTATNGFELWKIDSTTGKPVVIDIVSGSGSSSPTNLTNVNGTLFFKASNAANGEELWKLDSTGNPVLVKDIYSGSNGSSPSSLFNVNGTLYFTANDGTNGVELWKSDGNTAGTVQLEIYPGAINPNISNFLNVGSVLYFTANNATNGQELWRINSTTGNPEVIDIVSGTGSSSPAYLTNVNGTLYFQAYTPTNGYELWKIDPTTGKPVVIDIVSGSGSSSPGNLTDVNGTLYFTAYTSTNGYELWKIDTTTGTPSVIDVVSGGNSSSPTNLTNVNGTLYFTASTSANGNELWKLDATTGSPVFLKDIQVGSGSSNPGNLTYSNGKLYFTADNFTQGVELWAVDINTVTTVGSVAKTGNEDQTITFSATDFSGVFSSSSGISLATIKVVQLPSNGVLKLGTNNVTVNQEIAVANLGNLTFVPNANFNGTAGFTWNGSDGTNYAANPSNVIFTINSVNDVPEIVNPIPDINFYSNTFSNFNISENAFRDADLGDSLTYSATLADGSPLPSWLTLNNKIFSGTPPISSTGKLEIKVTATDPNNASVADNFILTVINSAPTSIYLSKNTIPENSANNTVIGNLISVDANANDTHTYTLINDAGGRFALNGNQIVVANGGLLDYETATGHIIRVKTTDSTGLSYEGDISISISNVNDAFTGSFSFTAATYNINERGTAIISLTRTGGSDGEVSVTVTATDGIATAGSDYNNSNLPVTLTFANGETSKNVIIPIIDDNVYEPTETVNLALSNPSNGATLGTETTAILNIIDNDPNTNLPDLVVSNIVAPINAQSGEVINISWTLTNQGIATASGSWVDYVYLSDDDKIGNDKLLGSFTFDGAMATPAAGIAAGASVERTQSITLPLILSGNQQIIVSTDANNQILEYSGTETNNTTIDDIPIAVTLKTFPNLQVSNVAAPLTAFSSQSTAIQWTVKNVGNGATSSPYWSDSVYLSLDNTFDDTDIYLGQANNPSYLNAGDSYTNHLDVTLPRGISGNYYFLVKTDVRNNVFENDKENDNLTVGSPTNVSLTPPPDFQVTNVTIPSQSFSGQSLNLSWTVTNKGIGKNLETVWYDQVFLSTDEVLDADDRNLGTFSQNGILNSNDSYTSSQTVSLPIGISGDYYFFVRTDAGNQVFESVFDGNNTGYKATPTRINLTPPPDLEILSLTLPTQATASRALNFSYQVTNFGSTTTPNYYWTDRFYLSLDNQLDTNTDLLIGDQPHYGSLAPDESYTNNFSYTLPNTLTGNYYLFGITDSNNEVFELNNENNTFLATTPIVITSQPADLVVVSASVPMTGEAGKALRVEWTVRNQGTGDTAISSWTDQVILSKDAQIGNSDDLVLGSFSRGEILAPNQSYTRSELVTLPIDAIAGYQVFVVTDAGNSVYEATQENNNSSTGQPLTVTRETADLQVTEVSSPSSGQSGQALTVNWTVKNFGSSTTNSNYWYDGVYLSTDNQISSDDIFLGYAYRSEALDVSEQYSVSRSFNLPNNLQAGNYYTLVRTDALSYVYEGSLENNNDKATQGTTTGTGGETTGGTSVGVTASPDLVMVSVDAPTTGIGGQNLTVSWTVRNAGTVETGDRSWYEAFYLSRDQVFDRNSDIYLGYRSYTGNLAAGATYSQTESFRLPQGISGSFYLFAKTDAGNSLYEGTVENNNVAYDPTSVVVSLAQPADLVVGTITIPANGVTGQSASITYTVTNEGSNAVVGNWSDSLYLSKDGQWDINDLFLGQVDNSREVLSGNSYTNTLTASLPGVVPGDYQVIIRSDIRNEIPESNESNNLKATLDKVNMDVERLILGTPSTGSLAQGQGGTTALRSARGKRYG
ncbi:ELWxxDGT repeat protein [Anabaena sp. WA102]|uniref:ELWxxDGT repeat protein n=1 Tax=Anabaena sp. WA102 TaxID=1647413 RepID=UPI0006ABEE36|nr:ELWxxDGT repeat protein [Anabaena sp. WA102]